MLRHALLLAPLALCGCFRGFDAVDHSQQTEPPTLELEVSDQNASLWDADNAPRSPVLTLRASRTFERDAERHVFLLRGTPTEEVIEDLRSGTLRESTARHTIALDVVTRGADAVSVRPSAALTPGARYTLLWAEPGSSAEFSLRISSSPAAGARLVQSMPAALDARVPHNLARALLRFDGYVEGDLDAALQLRDAEGKAVAHQGRVLPCDQLGLPPGDCIELKPLAPLVELARYVLGIGAGLRDATGVAIPEQEISFRTVTRSASEAPDWLTTKCAKDESTPAAGLCVLADDAHVNVRARANENGLLSLTCGQRTQSSLGVSGDYEITLALERGSACLLLLIDQAGNQLSRTLELAPASDLPEVTIAEVRADPLGPEPAQEYVELLNFGDRPRSLRGFTLTTDVFATGAAIVSDLTLAPGERVLAVAPDFDPGDVSDGPLPPGVRIARLERALSLRNDGAALFLRDAAGRRIAASPALETRAGQCIARSGTQLRQGGALDFRPDPSGGCTPGFASDAP